MKIKVLQMANNNSLTPDIIIETLKRSNLNTVLIEGLDDVDVYRTLEDYLDITDISFLECQGRSNLLKVFERRNEIKDNVLFICDSDLWVILGKPDIYTDNRLIATEGYSIENDIFIDGEEILTKLLKSNEVTKRDEIIKSICEWYSHEISLIIKDASHDCKFSDVTILNTSTMKKYSAQFEQAFLINRSYVAAEKDLCESITNDFNKKLRGKFIFQIFEKIFQERQKKSIKYSKAQLFDIVLNFVLSDTDDEKILVKRKLQIIDFFETK